MSSETIEGPCGHISHERALDGVSGDLEGGGGRSGLPSDVGGGEDAGVAFAAGPLGREEHGVSVDHAGPFRGTVPSFEGGYEDLVVDFELAGLGAVGGDVAADLSQVPST